MEKSFESSLVELERLVEQLEAGELPLEKSLELFERGIALSRECRSRLSDAERRIEILVKENDGTLTTRELEREEQVSET